MAQGLIIVESPAKARTLKRFLGDRYDVVASMGHVRDLPERELSVDVEHDFEPTYVVVEDRERTIRELRTAVGKAAAHREVILASDPDREGEAIAWHITQATGIPRNTPIYRVEFSEITRNAVQQADKEIGQRYDLNTLLRELALILGVEPEVQRQPARPGDVPHSLADISKARRLLGYEPVVDFREDATPARS